MHVCMGGVCSLEVVAWSDGVVDSSAAIRLALLIPLHRFIYFRLLLFYFYLFRAIEFSSFNSSLVSFSFISPANHKNFKREY